MNKIIAIDQQIIKYYDIKNKQVNQSLEECRANWQNHVNASSKFKKNDYVSKNCIGFIDSSANPMLIRIYGNNLIDINIKSIMDWIDILLYKYRRTSYKKLYKIKKMIEKNGWKVLNEIIFWRGKPMKIRVDNGPEFISNALQKWAKDNEIKLKFIQPGKPTQNAYVERFNRFFREDILDAYLFNDLSEVRHLVSEWMDDYNEFHPHKSLGGKSPLDYVKNEYNHHILNSKESSLPEPVKGI